MRLLRRRRSDRLTGCIYPNRSTVRNAVRSPARAAAAAAPVGTPRRRSGRLLPESARRRRILARLRKNLQPEGPAAHRIADTAVHPVPVGYRMPRNCCCPFARLQAECLRVGTACGDRALRPRPWLSTVPYRCTPSMVITRCRSSPLEPCRHHLLRRVADVIACSRPHLRRSVMRSAVGNVTVQQYIGGQRQLDTHAA